MPTNQPSTFPNDEQPGPVEDLFDSVNPIPPTPTVLHTVPTPIAPLTTQPQPPVPPAPTLPQVEPEAQKWHFPQQRLLITVGAGVLLLVALSLLGWKYWSGRHQESIVAPEENLNHVQPLNNAPSNTATGNTNGAIVDSDGDGLLDSEEQNFRTDPKVVDTDHDGLSDRQEVKIYSTNPNEKDTDKDGFSDGEEVRNFYNPNGSGKMLAVPDVIQQSNTNNQ